LKEYKKLRGSTLLWKIVCNL